MAGIRGKQMHDQIKILQFQKSFEKMLADLKAKSEKAAIAPKKIAVSVSKKQSKLMSTKSLSAQLETANSPLGKHELVRNNYNKIINGTQPTPISNEFIDTLKKYGMDKNYTPLCKAILAKDLNSVNLFLKNGYSPNEIGGLNLTAPLEAALNAQDTAILECLLKNGADPLFLIKNPGYMKLSYKSPFLSAVTNYCFFGDAFSKKAIDIFISYNSDLKKPIMICSSKEYNATQTCLNLEIYINAALQYTKISDIHKERASELLTIFIERGVYVY